MRMSEQGLSDQKCPSERLQPFQASSSKITE